MGELGLWWGVVVVVGRGGGGGDCRRGGGSGDRVDQRACGFLWAQCLMVLLSRWRVQRAGQGEVGVSACAGGQRAGEVHLAAPLCVHYPL
jgi:hypothetical protein